MEKVSGEEGDFVHFNPVYLIDLLRVIDSKQVECGFRDNKTAGLFSIPDHPEAYRHIVCLWCQRDAGRRPTLLTKSRYLESNRKNVSPGNPVSVPCRCDRGDQTTGSDTQSGCRRRSSECGHWAEVVARE